MKPPAFWLNADRSALAQVLRPIAFVYGAIAARRMARPGARVGVPVITIGNLVAGGAGKTPAAMAMARLLAAHGETPAFLSRGYGGAISRSSAVVRVKNQDAREVGDEPLLLARIAPTFVGADRIAAGRRALADARPSVLILDDGLQSRRIEPDIALAIVDGETGVGNGLSLPAGFLRAPLLAQLKHVSAVVIVGAGDAGARVAEIARRTGLPVFSARLVPDESAKNLSGEKVVAFAGIGRPEKFFATLENLGANIVAQRAFADHHRYSEADMAALAALAQTQDARLVTTEKDFVRLPRFSGQGPKPEAVAVSLVFDDADALAAFVQARLERARAK